MNNRVLGTLAIVCAPALLIESLIPNGENIPLVIGTSSMVFMVGELCSLIGLWRLEATGRNWWGRGVLAIQLVLATLAFFFGFFEATGLLNDKSIIFVITDMCWPLSMIFMLVVGITAAVVGRLPGLQRFVPLLCGLAFLVSIAVSLITGIEMAGQLSSMIFFSMLMVAWVLLGLVVRQSGSVAMPLDAAAYSAVQ